MADDTRADGIAEAVERLSDDTRTLVRRELDAARGEMWDKAKTNLPGAALLGASAVLGAFGIASGYRYTARLFDKALPPATAALVATVTFGVAAGVSAGVGMRWLRATPVPFPTETVAETREALGDTHT